MGVTLDLSRAANLAQTGRRPEGPLDISGLTREQLRTALVEAQVCAPDKAKMRANQIWRWVHHFGVTDFDRMTDVAKIGRAHV